jgi:hypothetical protein
MCRQRQLYTIQLVTFSNRSTIWLIWILRWSNASGAVIQARLCHFSPNMSLRIGVLTYFFIICVPGFAAVAAVARCYCCCCCCCCCPLLLLLLLLVPAAAAAAGGARPSGRDCVYRESIAARAKELSSVFWAGLYISKYASIPKCIFAVTTNS